MELIVRVPGSCGELVQGYMQGMPFLITCPVDLYAAAVVNDKLRGFFNVGSKARRVLQRTLSYIGETEFPFGLTIQSELPQRKGMASSSADAAAVIIATAAVFGKCLSEDEIGRLAALEDPTDGVFCQGIVSINYHTGQILRAYGPPPPLKIAVFDTGGYVDTVAFHAAKDRLAPRQDRRIDAALRLLDKTYTAEAVGYAATWSAQANQCILFKDGLKSLIQKLPEWGGLGVNVAHSGTVLGVLFPGDMDTARIEDRVRLINANILPIQYMRTVSLISGGWTVEYRR